jgi:Na+-transporting NADH:ubiquinone oxidoreductase subunit F
VHNIIYSTGIISLSTAFTDLFHSMNLINFQSVMLWQMNPRDFFGVLFFIVVLAITLIALTLSGKIFSERKKVKIALKNGIQLEVSPGSSLLETLSEQGIFLPTTCGGEGICTLCRCHVISGGGTVQQAETEGLTSDELKENWRLACQVKVRKDMIIQLPDGMQGIKKWDAEVVSNRFVAPFIAEIILKLPQDEFIEFQSGSYLRVEIPQISIDFRSDISIPQLFLPDWDRFGMRNLKVHNTKVQTRTYSFANPPSERNQVIFNVRISPPPIDPKTGKFRNLPPGIGSSYLFSRKAGDRISIMGPYGDFYLTNSLREMVFIGGGAGMAPLRSHLLHLFQMEKTSRKVSFWYGARTERDLFYMDEFQQIATDFPNFSLEIALSEVPKETKSPFHKGLIHELVLEKYLKSHPNPRSIEFYICGPQLMTAAVYKMLEELGVSHEMIASDSFGG